MNSILESRIRAISRMRSDLNAASELGYDECVRATSGIEHRDRAEYDELIKLCKECSPNGICKMCGCMYTPKLVLKAFTCKLGKFQ